MPDITVTIEVPDIEVVEEKPAPTLRTGGGTGREAYRWEEVLAAHGLFDNPGKWLRFFVFPNEKQAHSRAVAIKNRVNKALPSSHVRTSVRPLKLNSDGTAAADSHYGVYFQFVKDRNPEEQAAYEKAREARVTAAAATKERNGTSTPTHASAAPQASSETPAQRAKRAAKKAS